MPSLVLYYLAVFGAAVVLAAVFTRFVRDFSVRHGLVSTPAAERHVHRVAIPRLGGVAIVATIFAVVGLSVATVHLMGIAHLFPHLRNLLLLLAGGLVVFAVGVYDDLRHARPALKILAQTIAACLIYAGGFRFFGFELFHQGESALATAVGLPLTIVWVVWITNAFNLIDGLDGLAAGSALLPASIMFVVALIHPNVIVATLSLALVGSILGFLRYNFNPATIFLGDSGSMFIGFLLSALSLVGRQKTSTLISVATLVLLFGLPILDTVLSVIRRAISGRPIFAPDREHIHHKLLDLGLSHRAVVVLLYGASAVFALASVLVLVRNGTVVGIVLLMLFVGVVVGVRVLGYSELIEISRAASGQRGKLMKNIGIRKCIERMKRIGTAEELAQVVFEALSVHCDFFSCTLQGAGARLFTDGLGHTEQMHWRGSEYIEGGPAWELRLAIGSSERYLGVLEMGGCRCDTSPHIDLDLISGEFIPALADAICRLSGEQPSVATIAVSSKQAAGATS